MLAGALRHLSKVSAARRHTYGPARRFAVRIADAAAGPVDDAV